MPPKSIDAKLDCLLAETTQSPEPVYPAREQRIFTNRNIKFSRIQALGFDMDYTLAEYQQDALEKTTMRLSLQTLVDDNGYPDSILDLPYKEGFAIRGLVMDTVAGNVLKMDKFRYVSLAYHGLKKLDSETRTKLYNEDRIIFGDGRYRSVDTLFEILEAYLYAALIEHLEQIDYTFDFQKLYGDLRNAIDLCHRDGRLKSAISADPDRYIKYDPHLVPSLHTLRESGRKLFVLTNSEPEYTEFMLSYLFRNAEPFFNNWREAFEIVASFSRKPSFFTDGNPAEIIEESPNFLFFSSGNREFLEERLGVAGDRVLYVGDHIYGDILKSKHTTHWRTCLIVPELPDQIHAERHSKPWIKELKKNNSARKQITMELNWRRNQAQDLQQFKEAESDELDLDAMNRIDECISELSTTTDSLNRKLSELIHRSHVLRRNISGTFNRYWGRLFKAGGQLSIFAEQIRDYACIYTSRVSNFSYYGVHSYLESQVTPMPHEDNISLMGDVNFDASMEPDEHDVMAETSTLE